MKITGLATGLDVAPVSADISSGLIPAKQLFSPVVSGQRCDALGAAAPVLDELPDDGVTQWLHPRPLWRQRPGSGEVVDDVAPSLQVRARCGQVQPVPGFPEQSTLAQRLASDHGFTVVHSGRTPDGVDLAERYRQILSQPGRLALDRSFVSELVYGPLRHGGSRLTDADAYDLATVVARRDGVLVHLTAVASAIRAHLLVRDGQLTSLADIESVVAAYERVVTAFTAYLTRRPARHR